MPILNLYNVDEFKVFLLVLARFSVVLFMLPIFATRVVPRMVKTCLCMVLSLLLYSVVDIDSSIFPETAIETGLLIFTELMIGVVLSLCVRFFLGAIQFAGQIIGFQMGFSMVNVVDPLTGANVSILEEISYWMTLLIFLLFNGHHILILCVIDSFKIVPPGVFFFKQAILDKLTEQGTELFVLAIKIGAPVIASLLFTNVALGLTGKFAPQMNIMTVAFPFQILVGFMLFGFSLEIIKIVTREYIGGLKALFLSLFFWASGGG
ncbi:MAG: flagellar biosynthetic protein FliR [Desulfamplus sp.]|nr:flagellar biosynthetic protein FliR [Desulfamplus sp.]